MEQIIQDTLPEEGEPTQAVAGTSRKEGVLRRYYSFLFYFKMVAQDDQRTGEFDDLVEVQFDPTTSLEIYANLTGEGFAVEIVDDVQRVGTERFIVRVYAPPQAGGLTRLTVRDNENYALAVCDFDPFMGKVARLIAKELNMDWLTGGKPVDVCVGAGERTVREVWVPRPRENSWVTVTLTNVWGGEVTLGPYHVRSYALQITTDILKALVVMLLIVIAMAVVNKLLAVLRGRRTYTASPDEAVLDQIWPGQRPEGSVQQARPRYVDVIRREPVSRERADYGE